MPYKYLCYCRIEKSPFTLERSLADRWKRRIPGFDARFGHSRASLHPLSCETCLLLLRQLLTCWENSVGREVFVSILLRWHRVSGWPNMLMSIMPRGGKEEVWRRARLWFLIFFLFLRRVLPSARRAAIDDGRTKKEKRKKKKLGCLLFLLRSRIRKRWLRHEGKTKTQKSAENRTLRVVVKVELLICGAFTCLCLEFDSI